MAGLTPEQREQVLGLYKLGLTVSQATKKLGLVREYVQAFYSYHNSQGHQPQ